MLDKIIHSNTAQLKVLIEEGLDLTQLNSKNIQNLIIKIDKLKLKFLLERGLSLTKLDYVAVTNIIDSIRGRIPSDYDAGGHEDADYYAELEELLRFFEEKALIDRLADFVEQGLYLDNLSYDLVEKVILKNSESELEFLLDKGIDLSKLNSLQIYNIIRNSDKSKLEFLLDKGLDITRLKSTAIATITTKSDPSKLRLLFEKGGLTERCVRDGKITQLKTLQLSINLDTVKPNPSKNFFESTKQSCFNEDDSLDKVDIKEVEYPLTVVQNFCDTMVKLSNDKVLILKGQEAKKVHHYLKDKKAEELQICLPETKQYHKFEVYINPGHGFLSIDGKPLGFYPNDDISQSELKNDNTAEYVMHGILAGTAFFFTLGVFSVPALCVTMPKLLPAIGAATLSVGGTYAIYAKYADEYMPAIDHKIGKIEPEDGEQSNSDQNTHLKISFIIDDDQAENLKSFIKTVNQDCKSNKADYCMYNFATRNCMVFLQDAFKAAGLKGDFTDYFTSEQLDQYNLGSFSEGYDTKALIYARMKKGLSSVEYVHVPDISDNDAMGVDSKDMEDDQIIVN